MGILVRLTWYLGGIEHMLFTPVDGKLNKENDDRPLDTQTKPYSKDMKHPKHIAIPGSSNMKKHMSLFHQGFVWWVVFFKYG